VFPLVRNYWKDSAVSKFTVVAGPELVVSGAAVVVHRGRSRVLTAGEVLTFGRAASCTACLDPQDRGISRLAGCIEHDAGT
jgi:hypothetical protein